MTTVSQYQGGFARESSYGSVTTPDTFFVAVSDTIKPMIATLESKGLRPGLMPHQSTFVRYSQGAGGQLKFEVSSKQFNQWCYQMLGDFDSTNSIVDGSYKVHTYTMEPLNGASFTWQHQTPFSIEDDGQAYTFSGGKVTKWSLSNSVDQLLELTLDCDFQDWTDGTNLATAQYPNDDILFSFLGAAVLIDGTSVPCHDITVDVDNTLKVDRRYLDGSGLKSEQVENGFRVGTWAATLDFEDTDQVDRIAALSAGDGAVAAITATWGIPGSDIAEIEVEIPVARFDEGWPEVTGPEMTMQPLKGGIMSDNTNSPVTITFTTRTQSAR